MESGASQHRITEAGPLLTQDGTLAEAGWATQPLLSYERKKICASRLRIKEWDYYLVHDNDYALAFTISDLGYMSMASVSMLSFIDGGYVTESTLGIMPLGRIGLPASSDAGLSAYQDKRTNMYFAVADGMRHLVVEFGNFVEGETLYAELALDQEPQDTMVIATPWAEDPLAFYYNQKIIGMRAIGSFRLGGLHHTFAESESLALLDWGRGVWTRDNTWYWAAAQGHADGHIIGLNLGYGFGDTSAASENMFFFDGVCNKLDRVEFEIPIRDENATRIGERYTLLMPWRIADNEQRLELEFMPQIDRTDFINLKLISSDQHQVFGLFNGWVKLDDGTRLDIKNLRGSAEVVHNIY